MTSLIEQVSEEDSTITKDANDNLCLHHRRNALRYKLRSKCNKVLKRKLKKYKLRQDGKEDEEIIDVSGILESSLTITSEGEERTSVELELEQFRIPNYLFKMGRKKQSDKSIKPKTDVRPVNENGCVQISPTAEEKKQTNAFKLLMDSRNKSIGSNSPGKEKPVDEMEMQEFIDKKNIKAKRTLVLQKMAESKGSLKNKETEENQEKYINKKMEKRAEKLKSMIINKEPKPPKNLSEKIKIQNGRSPLNSIKTEKNEKLQPVKKLQLVNMFTDVKSNISPQKNLISKEDEEFINKLSPSLKKKESMLSYFKKVEKEPDCTLSETEIDNTNTVIKVKLNTKLKKKGKKKKLSLNKNCLLENLPTNEVETIEPEQVTNGTEKHSSTTEHYKAEEITSKDRRKRKRQINHRDDTVLPTSKIDNGTTIDDGRPRRSVKRPVKYEDAVLSSSDEELHICTPKKKKHSIKTLDDPIDLSSDNEASNKPQKKIESAKNYKTKKATKSTEKGLNDKKSMKLAPIFSTKSQIDLAALEAKQKFLQSGVPDQLKKIISKQVDKNITSNWFFKVVHIQQLKPTEHDTVQTTLIQHDLSFEDKKDPENYEKLSFQTLLNMALSQNACSLSLKQNTNAQTVLHSLKEKYPRYPVYRTYRLLRGKKKGDYKNATNYLDLDNSVEILNASIDNQNVNPEQLSWADKYKPLAANQIIGNFESVKELRKWLVSWTENDMKRKGNLNESDSSDYYQSDADSKDSMKSSNNLLILSGPIGSGKTSSVYAIAAELSIKVIEVNASSKRTGKIMLQDLQEATQSHKVNRASSNENSQKSQESVEMIPVNLVKKRGRPKKLEIVAKKPVLKKMTSREKIESTDGPASQESSRTCMSLILIDDADIIFDQDDGFCSAIVQLVHCSKRPVILITSSLTCPHLQRFIQSSKILKMSPLLPNILGTWLDILCLADSGICWPGVGAETLNFFKGDVRKTINCLQFYVCSQEQASSQDAESGTQNADMKVNVDDENSNMSWTERGLNDEATELNDPSRDLMLERAHSMHHKNPPELFDIWWSLPNLLSINRTERKEGSTIDDKTSRSIESISKVLDSISLSDYYGHNSLKNESNLASEPWFSQECHSVSELENFDKFDRHLGTTDDIQHELAKFSIRIAQSELGCSSNIDFDQPGMAQQRQRDRIVSRHNNLTGYLSPQAVLDRKALALDYWSTCRTICRIEKSRTDTNSKRNNRFCHYLKSLSVLCKNDSFDKLANSLGPSDS